MKTQLVRVLVAGLAFLAANASATVLYVDLNCTNPVPPYADWSTAATNIQDAIDAATNGDLVLVTNGVYASGGRKWFDSGTNRVTLTNAITLQSVNGPAVTLIVGNHVAGTGPALTNAVRCVGIGNNAVLSGFTLTNGEAGFGNYPAGGGVANLVSVSAAGTVTNCVLVGNLSTNDVGGGAYRVRLINCQLTGNYATSGGGACSCTLNNCTVVSNTATSGGGVFGGSVYGASALTNCTILGNSASSSGGGVYGGTLNACSVGNNTAVNGGGAYQSALGNCVLKNNLAGSIGGGAYQSALGNCTVVNNAASGPSLQPTGGGVYGGSATNCIIYYNLALKDPNLSGSASVIDCCTTPLPAGSGNITNEPGFVNLAAGDFHLQSNSPCINSGDNASVTTATDFDGNPRIVGGTVDIGAYEYQTPTSIISYAWLQQYGLPTDGSADYADTDGTGMNNWQKWIAGLNPTNPASVLVMLTPVSTDNPLGLVVSWQSVNTRTYYLQSSTNLGAQPAFPTIQSNLVGQVGTTSYMDTNAVGSGPYFYRVGVQQ